MMNYNSPENGYKFIMLGKGKNEVEILYKF